MNGNYVGCSSVHFKVSILIICLWQLAKIKYFRKFYLDFHGFTHTHTDSQHIFCITLCNMNCGSSPHERTKVLCVSNTNYLKVAQKQIGMIFFIINIEYSRVLMWNIQLEVCKSISNYSITLYTVHY